MGNRWIITPLLGTRSYFSWFSRYNPLPEFKNGNQHPIGFGLAGFLRLLSSPSLPQPAFQPRRCVAGICFLPASHTGHLLCSNLFTYFPHPAGFSWNTTSSGSLPWPPPPQLYSPSHLYFSFQNIYNAPNYLFISIPIFPGRLKI